MAPRWRSFTGWSRRAAAPVLQRLLAPGGGRPRLESGDITTPPSSEETTQTTTPPGTVTSPGTTSRRPGPRRYTNPGGTFTPSSPRVGQSGGHRALGEDEVEGLRRFAERRQQQEQAAALVTRLRRKLGREKIEALAELPRAFAGQALADFRQARPEVSAETLKLVMPLLSWVDPAVRERASARVRWTPEESERLVSGCTRPQADGYHDALEALAALSTGARQELLRLPAAPMGKALNELAAKWPRLPKRDVQAAALAVAQLSAEQLTSLLGGPSRTYR